MTGATMLVAALLLVAAALVAWPVRSIRARRRRVLTTGRRSGGVDPDDALVQWIRELGRTPDGPVDGTGAAPTSGHPAGIGSEPTNHRGCQRKTDGTRLARPGRHPQPGWPGSRQAGFTRPEGPNRPPARRDPRRPTGAARPEVGPPPRSMPNNGLARRWPRSRSGRAVWTRPVGTTSPAAATTDGHGDLDGLSGRHVRRGGGRRIRDRRLPAPTGVVGPTDRPAGTPPAAGASRGRRAACCRWSVCSAVVCGAVLGGPVAAVAMAGYGTLAVRAALRWRVNRSAERDRRRGLDQLCGLAADLRAGLPVPHALEAAAGGAGAEPATSADLGGGAIWPTGPARRWPSSSSGSRRTPGRPTGGWPPRRPRRPVPGPRPGYWRRCRWAGSRSGTGWASTRWRCFCTARSAGPARSSRSPCRSWASSGRNGWARHRAGRMTARGPPATADRRATAVGRPAASQPAASSASQRSSGASSAQPVGQLRAASTAAAAGGGLLAGSPWPWSSRAGCGLLGAAPGRVPA